MTLAVILVPLKLTLGGADGFTDTVGCSLGASAFHGTIHKFVSVSLCCFVAVYCCFAGVLHSYTSLTTKFPEYIWNSLSFPDQQIPWDFQVFQSCKHPALNSSSIDMLLDGEAKNWATGHCGQWEKAANISQGSVVTIFEDDFIANCTEITGKIIVLSRRT